MSIFDVGKEDFTKDRPRPTTLSLEGLPEYYAKLGDSTPIRLKNIDNEELTK